MPNAGYLPDESSLSTIETDPEHSQFWGTDYAVMASPQASGMQDAVLMGNLIPPSADVGRALAVEATPGTQQLDGPKPTPTKYADELMEDLYYSVAPVSGMLDGDKAAILTQGYDPYLTKEPKLRGNEQPSTGEIASNTATSPGSSLPTTESQLMSLLFDF